MEEEKKIRFTKNVGEEINLLGCLRVPLTSKFCKTIKVGSYFFFAEPDWRKCLVEHVSLFVSPARIPLPANKEIKYFCLSKLRGWLDNTCNLFRWPPIWILEIFVDSAKQTVPFSPILPVFITHTGFKLIPIKNMSYYSWLHLNNYWLSHSVVFPQ